jgi:hypothetical protein
MSTRKTGGALRPRSAVSNPRMRSNAMSNNVKIVAILTARPGKTADLRALLDHMVAPSGTAQLAS